MKRQTDPDVRFLQGAADPTRLAILRQLSAASPVCACDFTDTCDVSQPTVSHHLKVLTETGWVDTERRGSWIWYRIRPDAVLRFERLLGQLSPGIAAPAGSVVRSDRRLPVLQSPNAGT